MKEIPIDDPVGHALASTDLPANVDRAFWLVVNMRDYHFRGTVGTVTAGTVQIHLWEPVYSLSNMPISDEWKKSEGEPVYIARHAVQRAQVVYFDE